MDTTTDHFTPLALRMRGNNMKIRVWTVLWTIIRKARNHCQEVDNCGMKTTVGTTLG